MALSWDPDPGWIDRCRALVRAGADLMVVQGADPADQALAVLRRAWPAGLIGIAEPADPATRADLVLLAAPDQARHWPGRLRGCRVNGPAQAWAAQRAGCVFLVVGADLVPDMGRDTPAWPDMVWFVSGFSSVEELAVLTRLGARRAWVEPSADLAEVAVLLRQAGRADRRRAGLPWATTGGAS
jgi:hypothetical protein